MSYNYLDDYDVVDSYSWYDSTFDCFFLHEELVNYTLGEYISRTRVCLDVLNLVEYQIESARLAAVGIDVEDYLPF